jgi:hypothetical protein
MTKARLGLLLLVALGVGLFLATAVRAEPPGGDGDEKRSLAPAVAGKKNGKHGWLFECTAPSGGLNTRLDCDDPFPNNEPNIVVDPADPQHQIASSNDYGSCCDQYYTTFNAGATWSTGNMSVEDASRTGSDPVTTINVKRGVALHSSLNYTFNDDGEACDGDVVVSRSLDGGLTWKKPVVVFSGQGCDLDPTQIFNDKEWISTDNDPRSRFYGRTYLTWTAFLSHEGEFVESPIMESHSDNGGVTWSKAQEISGSNRALCTFQEEGPAGECDESQASVSTVAPDGTVYVAFMNSQNQALWEPGEQFDDQYLVVKSTNGGASWSTPAFAAGLEDGSRDYPINVDGRQTLTGYQVRVWGAGNIVASPIDGKLYLVYSENSHGVHDSANPVTNSDVFITTSTDGVTWTTPVVVDSGAGDQWFPWADVNPTNAKVGVLYHDRGASNGPTYNTALAEGQPGSFVKTIMNTAPSNPTMSEFFQAGDPACEFLRRLPRRLHRARLRNRRSGECDLDGHARSVPVHTRLFLQFIYYARK